MTEPGTHLIAPRRYWPLGQLILARLREFVREKEAVFWVYVFPLLMILALGIAFREQPVEKFRIDICRSPDAARFEEMLAADEQLVVAVNDKSVCLQNLRTGKTDLVLVVDPSADTDFQYHFAPTKPGSLVARHAVHEALQRAAGRQDVAVAEDVEHLEPGGRYIDFLVPGLLGMGLMGGGLWGVGFVTVDMRIRKLLKRFVATPMKRSDFLAALMISRMCGMVPEVLLLLAFSWLIFGVVVHGSLWAVATLILYGAVMFSGLGLLIACRARTLEAVSGLMNLTMLPMWVMSGIFFSSERFPEPMQPWIKLLPLTALIDALRAVMLEGASLASQGMELLIMAVWTVSSFALALKWFRWM